MKVVGKTISESETSVDIDLFEGRKLPKAAKDRIKEEVGQYLVEQTLASMGEKKSPVQGAPNFPSLSLKYKKRKKEEVGSTEANLEFDGTMKDEIAFEGNKDGISIGVYGERAGAADGHNNLSGKSKLPLRQFLPDEGESYKSNITKEVDRIIADIVAEEQTIKESDFEDIETKKELYDKLGEVFGPMNRTELRLSVFRNEDLTDILSNLNLIDLL
jgi:hypothetical protein